MKTFTLKIELTDQGSEAIRYKRHMIARARNRYETTGSKKADAAFPKTGTLFEALAEIDARTRKRKPAKAPRGRKQTRSSLTSHETV